MPKGVFDVSVLGIRTSRFSTTLNSVEHLKTVEIYPIGHQPLNIILRWNDVPNNGPSFGTSDG